MHTPPSNQSTPPITPSDPQALPLALTADEIAALLRIDRRSVYALVRRGELPGALRLGRVLRFSRDAVLRWLSEGQGRVRHGRRS